MFFSKRRFAHHSHAWPRACIGKRAVEEKGGHYPCVGYLCGVCKSYRNVKRFLVFLAKGVWVSVGKEPLADPPVRRNCVGGRLHPRLVLVRRSLANVNVLQFAWSSAPPRSAWTRWRTSYMRPVRKEELTHVAVKRSSLVRMRQTPTENVFREISIMVSSDNNRNQAKLHKATENTKARCAKVYPKNVDGAL